jgi:mycothiol synthase
MQTQTRVKIRPFASADYDDFTRLHNGTFGPEFTKEPNELRFDDEHMPSHCKWARWIAEIDGNVVGACGYSQPPYIYHPRRYMLEITVDPDWYIQGVGRALYDHVMAEVMKLGPERVSEWTREDMPCRVGFFERRGFVANMRMWTSVLDLHEFDPGRFWDRAVLDGLRITTLAELGVEDESVRRRWYDLWSATRADVPVPPGEVRAGATYEQWWERNNRDSLFPEGFFIALDGDRFVGLSQLWLSPSPDELRTGLTATLRDYRRRGIAFALKVRALSCAKARGYRYVRTENEVNNQGMIAINDELGFVKQPAWVHYMKSFA